MDLATRIRICVVAVTLLLLALSHVAASETVFKKSKPPPCPSKIYCHGPLLEMVQLNEIYTDDKTFVDQPLKFSPKLVLQHFKKFQAAHGPNPSKNHIIRFVNHNFYPIDGREFEEWIPADFEENPKFLLNIADPKLRTWASTLNGIWKTLGRNISEDVRARPDRYSMISVTNPFIVPGGRFREYYYWDSYWIQRGLLHSEMYQTVKGMISNFLELVDRLGYVPNGGRIYYERSQPPLLIPMMKSYFDATMDVDFLTSSLPTLEKEFKFWFEQRMVDVVYKRHKYRVAHYCVDRTGPRPESYSNDFQLASRFTTRRDKNTLYTNIQSAAEAGWDFSSRWYIPEEHEVPGNTSDTSTCNIIPVDLNAFLYYNAQILVKLFALSGDLRRGYYYTQIATDLKHAIQNLFWDEQLGAYFDYDKKGKDRITEFYGSTFVPLWAGVDTSPKTITRIINYAQSQKIFDFPGGIPTSLTATGEQWDLPNGWPPLNHIAIEALAKSGVQSAQNLALELTRKWVGSNYKAFYQQTPNTMFEKYDVTQFGSPGSGGEYTVVTGFGWTNGVILDLLAEFGSVLTV